ncbi:MAG TPA: TonB-dependent receptor plug domain-containing protein, partial [Kofleriaceae bacterium]|nr:TonB-dependent receptor plug domain-containing protein [Kofleriaceae bacterium]
MRSYRWVSIYLCAAAGRAFGDDIGGVQDITQMSLDDLLKTDVDVASKVPQTFREVPGVITVVTREEIMDSGARDLEDVLLLVPGFTLGIDVEAVTDVAVRGNWGHEGKVLLLVDGQQMNETLYSTNQLGNHYPIDQIERIEIIRGPGSAIYGGYAELAVINVVTRGADELDGVAVYGHAGVMSDTYGHLNLSVAAGETVGPGVKLSLSGLFGQGHRGHGDFTDFYGSSFPLTDHELDPAFINFGAKYKDLSLRFIYDHFGNDEEDGLAENETKPIEQKFIGYFGELAYKWR